MAIRRWTNQYRGINTHLHSQLQHEHAGWEVFHCVAMVCRWTVVRSTIERMRAWDRTATVQIMRLKNVAVIAPSLYQRVFTRPA